MGFFRFFSRVQLSLCKFNEQCVLLEFLSPIVCCMVLLTWWSICIIRLSPDLTKVSKEFYYFFVLYFICSNFHSISIFFSFKFYFKNCIIIWILTKTLKIIPSFACHKNTKKNHPLYTSLSYFLHSKILIELKFWFIFVSISHCKPNCTNFN